MSETIGIFEIEKEGETLVLTPQQRLGELDFEAIQNNSRKVLDFFSNSPPTKNIVLDFAKSDYFGSSALGFFIRLWRRVKNLNGRMCLCNVSEHGRQILEITKLGNLWPICDSREEALQILNS